MICEPVEPDVRFVWVRGRGDIGPPTPGVVVAWQHSPVHNVNESDWVALVASCPFGSALLLEYVGAERLVGVRDPAPAGDPR